MDYQTRVSEPKVREYLQNFSVVGLTVPRQSGKSTLIQHILPDYRYLSLG